MRSLVDSRPNGAEIHLMIGDPELIFADHYSELLSHIEVADSIGATGIHLDVEPHTFSDWEENSSTYLQQYVEMLVLADEWIAGRDLKLSVSVPASYKTIFKDLEEYSGKVILMTYGVEDFLEFSNRFGEAILDAPLGAAVALRPEDFDSESEMENLMKLINDGYGVNEFVIHDFESWQQMKHEQIK